MKWILPEFENESQIEEGTDASSGNNPGEVACCRGFCCGPLEQIP